MNLGQVFNAADAPSMDFTPLPVGDYKAIIVGSEIKESAKGSNYLSLKFEIIDGVGKGRQIYHILNLWNPSEMAKKIAVSELGKIQNSVNVQNLTDSAELHDKPMIITLSIEPPQNGYEASNKIKNFKALSAGATDPAKSPEPVRDDLF